MILEVPATAMINEAALRSSACHRRIEESSGLTATNRMALHLLYERDQPDSPWKPYIDSLPLQIPTFVFSSSLLPALTSTTGQNDVLHSRRPHASSKLDSGPSYDGKKGERFVLLQRRSGLDHS